LIFNEKACEVKHVLGGYLIQERDVLSPMTEEYKQITEKAATDAELEDMKFAQTIVKNVKSNAIVVVKDKMLLGVGAGQMNRVTSARIALDWAGEKAKGAVIGSDAFFPMDDTVRLAAERGITAIAQPGGSVRDEDSINACNELGVAMYFTGNRHFYH
jgi:phosphoribosylaminoimidazolecarboxamide formyltransferase/IMP cyclohydrolase